MKGSEKIIMQYLHCKYGIAANCRRSQKFLGQRTVAIKEAFARGWNTINGNMLCPECSKKVTENVERIKA